MIGNSQKSGSMREAVARLIRYCLQSSYLRRGVNLDETLNLVEKTGRRIFAEHGDVRDQERLKAAVTSGVNRLGRIDFVLAIAGVMPGPREQRYEVESYVDATSLRDRRICLSMDVSPLSHS